jgi:hypothetical protein
MSKESPDSIPSRKAELLAIGKRGVNGLMYTTAYVLLESGAYVLLNSHSFVTPRWIMQSIIIDFTEVHVFKLIDGSARVLFRPNLNTFSKWIPWMMATSTLTSCVSLMAHGVAFRNNPRMPPLTLPLFT